ncbi:GDP/GTP exchange factor Sec2p-domain-containing protein [Circinella umbellata]|nr:GDP/GTP exchange factor Sec2p-domain-containing protein [Circinella umbellata]
MSTPRSSSSSENNNNIKNDENDDNSKEIEEQVIINQKPPCSCQNILTDKNSTTCALCQRQMPIMQELHQEQQLHKEEINQLEQRVQEEQTRIARQLKEIEALQITVTQVEKRLDIKEEEFKALQNDMEVLNDKYVDEIERVAEIQHSKDMVENELEDLSRRLFEEANGMVANEKREKHDLEIAQKHLENKLKETQERLAAEQMQLKELRQKMEEMAQEQQIHRQSFPSNVSSTRNSLTAADAESTYSNQTDPEYRAARDLVGILSQQHSVSTTEQDNNILPSPPLSSIPNTVDQLLLNEFEEFVKTSPSITLKKLHTISFLKFCQTEDVEPCLRFGANARLSARKISEAIVMNTCFIEETPPGFAEEQAQRPPDMPLRISSSKMLLWERINNGGNTQTFIGACQACGRQDHYPLPYRFRTSYFDDWACIDRFCRDRLVAVCEFYVFIRNVRQGYYSSRSTLDLYQEALRLRLQMFYARMGALPWTLRNLGVKTDELGKATAATPPQIRIPPSVSESSPLPRTITTSKMNGTGSTTITKFERLNRPTSMDGRTSLPSPTSDNNNTTSTTTTSTASVMVVQS